jgi:hypothetical protein
LLDEIFERAVPWGLFIGVGALIGAAFPRETRAAAKRVMLAGFRAADWAQGMSAEAFEKGQDVFAEARLEYEQVLHEAQREAERGRLHVVQAPRRRSRRRSSSSTGCPVARASASRGRERPLASGAWRHARAGCGASRACGPTPRPEACS